MKVASCGLQVAFYKLRSNSVQSLYFNNPTIKYDDYYDDIVKYREVIPNKIDMIKGLKLKVLMKEYIFAFTNTI